MLKNLFEVETYRDLAAAEGEYDKLLNSYSKRFPELENENTKRKWDKLNMINQDIRNRDPMAFERINYVLKYIKNGSKILDIGFGSGNLEYLLIKNRKNLSLTGVDLSPLSVRNANKKFKNWRFKVLNLLKQDMPGVDWDVIVALEVFEHLPPSKVLNMYRKVHKGLKQEGIFIISVPLNEGLEDLIKHGENPNAHTRAYTPNIIKGELTICGFQIIRSKLLYAYHKNHFIKSLLANFSMGIIHPNNIIVIAKKK